MARYSYPSKYFADDKDIADLLESPKFSKKKLLQLAQDRGIFLSSELSRETVINYLSQIPFSWPDLQALLSHIETPDSEEKITACKITSKASESDLAKVLADLRDIRGETANEAYLIHKGADTTTIRISYSEVDHKSTRTLQRLHKEMEIAIKPITTGFEIRFPDNKRAQAIVTKIEDMLPIPDGEERPKRQSVELSGIADPGQRSDFFINLMDGMAGFRRRDVIDIKMYRFSNHDFGEDEEDDEADEASEQLKGLVKRTSIAGESLLSSPQYRQLRDDGFAVHRIIWEAMETRGLGRVFEIEAQFRNAEDGTGFSYLVRGVHNYNDDGELEVTKRALKIDDRKNLNKVIEDSAFSAVESLKSQANKETSSESTSQ